MPPASAAETTPGRCLRAPRTLLSARSLPETQAATADVPAPGTRASLPTSPEPTTSIPARDRSVGIRVPGATPVLVAHPGRWGLRYSARFASAASPAAAPDR